MSSSWCKVGPDAFTVTRVTVSLAGTKLWPDWWGVEVGWVGGARSTDRWEIGEMRVHHLAFGQYSIRGSNVEISKSWVDSSYESALIS